MIVSKLTSHPEAAEVVHSVEVIPATSARAKHPLKISDIMRGPFGLQTEMYCPTCDALLEMPAGNIATYLQQRLAELGGEDAFVEVRFHHKGPRPAIAPQRYRRVDPETKKLL
jgi:hypothetical protein